MMRRITPRWRSTTNENMTLATPSCMIVIPTMPGVRKSTYFRLRPATSSRFIATTGAVCVIANDIWSMTCMRIAEPTATCSPCP